MIINSTVINQIFTVFILIFITTFFFQQCNPHHITTYNNHTPHISLHKIHSFPLDDRRCRRRWRISAFAGSSSAAAADDDAADDDGENGETTDDEDDVAAAAGGTDAAPAVVVDDDDDDDDDGTDG